MKLPSGSLAITVELRSTPPLAFSDVVVVVHNVKKKNIGKNRKTNN